MTVSPQERPQVGTTALEQLDPLALLIKLEASKMEIRRLRRRVASLEAGRARWRTEARNWKWHALGWRRTRYV